MAKGKGVFQSTSDVLGGIGCLVLLVSLVLLFTKGIYRDWRAVAGFVLACIAYWKWLTWAGESESTKSKKAILAKLRPGVRFRAHGSMGTAMEGRCIRIIDDDTIEAYVGYADRPDGRETGPFPISSIDAIED